MPDAREVYQSSPEQYDRLIAFEDHDGALLRALSSLVTLDGADVVELGAGTGRLARLVAPQLRSLRAFDNAAPMLRVAREHMLRLGFTHCDFELADNACLPVAAASADISIAAWSYGHQTVWKPDSWRAPIEAALGEMRRVLRPGGTAIVIETLGTGHDQPFPPPPQLSQYYAMLEQDWDFQRTWIRTDYAFPSLEEGAELLAAFFGTEKAAQFLSRSNTVFPECTGIWHRQF